MNKKNKLTLVFIVIIVILVGIWFIFFFGNNDANCKTKDPNKHILIDISRSYTESSEISDFINYLECEGWNVYVLENPEISLKECLNEKKPNVTIIYNPWYVEFSEEDENALFEFIDNGGGFLYLKPRCFSPERERCLDLSRIGYHGEYESSVKSVPEYNVSLIGQSVKADSINEITEFSDPELFKNVEKLPNLGRPLNITEPLIGVAWSKNNTIISDTAECDCNDPYSDCYCTIKKTTIWGTFPYIAKAEYGNGTIIITSGTEEYIGNYSFGNKNIKNFLMNALELIFE